MTTIAIQKPTKRWFLEHSLLSLIGRAGQELGHEVEVVAWEPGQRLRAEIFAAGMTAARQAQAAQPELRLLGVEQGMFRDSSFVYPGIYGDSLYASKVLTGRLEAFAACRDEIEAWHAGAAAQELTTTKQPQPPPAQMMSELADFRPLQPQERDFVVLPLQYPLEQSFAHYGFDYAAFVGAVGRRCADLGIPLVAKPHPRAWEYDRASMMGPLAALAGLCDLRVTCDPIRELLSRSAIMITADSLPCLLDAAIVGVPAASCAPNLFMNLACFSHHRDAGEALRKGLAAGPADRDAYRTLVWLTATHLLWHHRGRVCWTRDDLNRMVGFLNWFVRSAQVPYAAAVGMQAFDLPVKRSWLRW